QSSEPLEALREELAGRRRYAHERLMDLGLRTAWPAGGLYLWAPVWELGRSGRAFAEQLREEKGVQVTPGDLFGPSGVGFVRVSFAGDEGRLREGLSRLDEFLNPERAATSSCRRAA